MLCRTWKNGEARIPAFLEDEALLALALLDLADAEGPGAGGIWHEEARAAVDSLRARFRRKDGPGLHVLRRGDTRCSSSSGRDLFDKAVPSASGAAARALARLALVTGDIGARARGAGRRERGLLAHDALAARDGVVVLRAGAAVRVRGPIRFAPSRGHRRSAATYSGAGRRGLFFEGERDRRLGWRAAGERRGGRRRAEGRPERNEGRARFSHLGRPGLAPAGTRRAPHRSVARAPTPHSPSKRSLLPRPTRLPDSIARRRDGLVGNLRSKSLFLGLSKATRGKTEIAVRVAHRACGEGTCLPDATLSLSVPVEIV